MSDLEKLEATIARVELRWTEFLFEFDRARVKLRAVAEALVELEQLVNDTGKPQ